jgi:hypothetical protein
MIPPRKRNALHSLLKVSAGSHSWSAAPSSAQCLHSVVRAQEAHIRELFACLLFHKPFDKGLLLAEGATNRLTYLVGPEASS